MTSPWTDWAPPERVDVDVAVVGAGPVGLALANELGWRGVRTLVVEATDGAVQFPAGEALFSRTMEHFRRWGLASSARERYAPPPDYPHNICFMTRADGRLLASFVSGRTNARTGDYEAFAPEGPAFLSRFELIPLLQQAASAWPSVQVVFEARLVAFDDERDGVTIALADSSGLRRVRCRYLVGCDGGRSTVRKLAGGRLEGTFAEGRNFAVHFRSRQLMSLVRKRTGDRVVQFHTLRSPRRPYVTIVDGFDEWRCSIYLDGHEAVGDPEQYVREAVGNDVDVEILRAQPWSGHRVVAERYRFGRVFLAGDAAHLLWPKGGFGANTGIGDAVDLGWKLAAVLDGWGGEALLESYEVERRPVAVRNVEEAAYNRIADGELAYEPGLDLDGPDGDAARARCEERIVTLRSREFNSIGIQLGYRYDGSTICIPDGSPPAPSPDTYSPTSHPGCRAPHAWLAPAVSTLDRFGRGFVLCRFAPKVDVSDLRAAAARVRMPCRLLDIADPPIARLYERTLVLVRPDGHVAWRGDRPPSDPSSVVDLVRGAAASRDPRWAVDRAR